jgi:hypothetical protein
MDVKTYNFIEQYNACAKVKDDSLKALEAKLAYARNHQKPLLQKLFVLFKI